MSRSADVVEFPQRDTTGWTREERAIIHRMMATLTARGNDFHLEYGEGEEGDPYAVVLRDDADAVFHICRINGVYGLEGCQYPARSGRSLRALIDQLLYGDFRASGGAVI